MMEQSSEQKKRTGFPCGFRHVVILMTFIGSMCCFFTRVSFSVALVAMVNSSHLQTNQNESRDSVCSKISESKNQSSQWTWNSNNDDNYSSTSQFSEQFQWDKEIQSFLLAAALYGCMFSPMLGGIMTQRFGIRWVFGITTLVCSILSIITPLVAGWGAEIVVAIRFLQGFLQGPLVPVQIRTVSLWTPSYERSRAFTFNYVGNQVGVVGGMLIAGILADSGFLGGWPSIFYVFGVFGCLWSVLWIVLVTDSPEQHWYVSDSELKYIQGGRQDKQLKSSMVPWKKILTSLPVWSYTLVIAGNAVAYFFLMTELPMFLNKVLYYDLKSSGALSAAPFLTQSLVALVGGYIADSLNRSKKLPITAIRKLMTALGMFGCALSFAAIAFSGCRAILIVVLLCASSGLAGFTTSGCFVAAIDMSPSFSATLTGISMTVSYLVGALIPYVSIRITSSGDTLENWSIVFIVCAVIIVLSVVQFLIFGKADRQPWDSSEPNEGKDMPTAQKEIGEIETQITKL